MKKNILLVLAVMILVRCVAIWMTTPGYGRGEIGIGSDEVLLEVYIYPARKKYKI